MTWTSTDRWTCPHPSCRETVAPDVPEADLPAALRAAQEQHAADHPAPRNAPPRSPSKTRQARDRTSP